MVCVDNKRFTSYLGENPFCNFINSFIEESKYCVDVIKIQINKEIAVNKKRSKDLKALISIGFATMFRLMVKLIDHFHFSKKYIGSAHTGCNINFKLKHKIPVVFHNVKSHDFHFNMEELKIRLKGLGNTFQAKKHFIVP